MSIQYRSTTTARWPAGSRMSAAMSAGRSSGPPASCALVSGGRSVSCSRTRRLRNRLWFALSMIRRT